MHKAGDVLGDIDMPLSVQIQTGGGGDFDNGFSEVIAGGLYPAKIIDMQDSEKNKWSPSGHSNETEPAIAFTFEIAFDGEESVTVTNKVTPKIGTKPPSNLDKIVKAAVGGEGLEKLIAIANEDQAKALAAVEKLKGKMIQLQVILETSDKGTQYNKLEGFVAPAGSGGKLKTKLKTSEKVDTSEDVSFDDDSIPF